MWLLEETRAAAGFALRPAGHQVLANVQQLTDRARRFETGGGLSFRSFVEQIEAEVETRSAESAADFKTDEELTARQAEFRRQVAWYAEAPRRTTGEPARAVPLRI